MVSQHAIERCGLGVSASEVLVGTEYPVVVGKNLGSFCNLRARGERRGCLHEVDRQGASESGVGVQSFEFAQGSVEASFEAGVIAGEAIELGGEDVVGEEVAGRGRGGHEFGFHAANAAQIPGGGEEFFKDDFLERALRASLGVELRAEFFEVVTLVVRDQRMLASEAVTTSVLGRAGFTFFGARSGAELGVGGVGQLAGG